MILKDEVIIDPKKETLQVWKVYPDGTKELVKLEISQEGNIKETKTFKWDMS